MKLGGSKPQEAPAATTPAEPAPNAGFGDDSGFGGETPEPEGAPANDKPFNDEPFDAGVEADEQSDPKKFIEQLTGKLGQSLRKYNEEAGQPDFELEKFTINSILAATHTSEMDSNDQDDIIKKVKEAGNNDNDEDSNDDTSNDGNGDGADGNNVNASFGGGDSGASAGDSGASAGGEVNEVENLFVEPKKNNMFQPGSNDELNIDKDLKESEKRSIFDKSKIKVKLQETFNQEDDMTTASEPMVKPAPVKTPAPLKTPNTQPKISPSRKNKPFLPMPEVQPDPKAISEGVDPKIYFNTYSGAVQAAHDNVEAKGYTVNPESWNREITFGSGKPKAGETRSHVIELLKDGKLQKKALAIQVYNRGLETGNTYELNYYIN